MSFRKKSIEDKIRTVIDLDDCQSLLDISLNHNKHIKNKIDHLSENVIGHFTLPYSIVPNVLINNKIYNIPFVTEESSIVAATSKAAKFWGKYGGITTIIRNMEKRGNVYFLASDDEFKKIREMVEENKIYLIDSISDIQERMVERGGGVTDIKIVDLPQIKEGYRRLDVAFLTADAMGANFINTILECFAKKLEEIADVEIIMAILSNFTPNCEAVAYGTVSIEDIEKEYSKGFVKKFELAIKTAKQDIWRQVTHNKGIMNGVDSVLMATCNDYRAVEACVHNYTSIRNNGSLTDINIGGGELIFKIKIPLPVGLVGGAISNHPMAKVSKKILNNPSIDEFMGILATVGLLQNFSAVAALVTEGIQKGHMALHQSNIERR